MSGRRWRWSLDKIRKLDTWPTHHSSHRILHLHRQNMLIIFTIWLHIMYDGRKRFLTKWTLRLHLKITPKWSFVLSNHTINLPSTIPTGTWSKIGAYTNQRSTCCYMIPNRLHNLVEGSPNLLKGSLATSASPAETSSRQNYSYQNINFDRPSFALRKRFSTRPAFTCFGFADTLPEMFTVVKRQREIKTELIRITAAFLLTINGAQRTTNKRSSQQQITDSCYWAQPYAHSVASIPWVSRGTFCNTEYSMDTFHQKAFRDLELSGQT